MQHLEGKRCKRFKPISGDWNEKENCGNCTIWEPKKERCRDEALLLAEWEKRYKSLEYIMKDNKGVVFDG